MISYLIIYFAVYSVLGWIYETVLCSIREQRAVNRGFLNGPYCPIYGVGAMLFLAYPLMLAVRFLCGFLGSQTAAIRQAAVQNYLPADMRARVNGVFSMLVSVGMLAVQLVVGALGELLPYGMVALLLCLFTLVMMWALIVRRRRQVEPVYNRKV